MFSFQEQSHIISPLKLKGISPETIKVEYKTSHLMVLNQPSVIFIVLTGGGAV